MPEAVPVPYYMEVIDLTGEDEVVEVMDTDSSDSSDDSGSDGEYDPINPRHRHAEDAWGFPIPAQRQYHKRRQWVGHQHTHLSHQEKQLALLQSTPDYIDQQPTHAKREPQQTKRLAVRYTTNESYGDACGQQGGELDRLPQPFTCPNCRVMVAAHEYIPLEKELGVIEDCCVCQRPTFKEDTCYLVGTEATHSLTCTPHLCQDCARRWSIASNLQLE